MEFFGNPSFIASHKKDLPVRKDDQEIKGYDGVVIHYDVNYRYRGGSMFKNGKKQQGAVQIRSGSQATLKKMAKGNKTADYTDPQPGCEYYFLVWYDTYTYEIIDWIYLGEWCPDDGENPYGNEGGGGGGGDGCSSCPIELDSPCETGKSLASNSNFKSQISNLQDLTNQNFESGYFKTVNSSADFVEGDPLTGGDWPAPPLSSFSDNSLEYIMHNHSSITGSLSIFSDEDLFSFVNIVGNTNKTADPYAFTLGVTTSQGTSYALVLENATKFATFKSDFVDSQSGRSLFNFAYNAAISPTSSISTNETNFLNLIKDSGIAVLKGNSNFTQWSKIGYNASTNSIKTKTCN